MTPFPYITVTRARVTSIYRKGVIGCQQLPGPEIEAPPMAADTETIPPVKPALARVTIFEVAERPWGWLTKKSTTTSMSARGSGTGS